MDFLDSLLTFPEFSSFTFDLEYIWNTVIPVLNKGLLVSISLIIPSILLGFFFGVLIGTCRVYGPPGLKKLMNLYTMLVRGVPLLVQMFILYYGLPKVGITFSPYVAGVLAFANGAVVQIGMSFDVAGHKHVPLEIYGTEGTLIVPDPNTFGGEVQLLKKGGAFEPQELSAPYADGNYRSIGLADMAHALRSNRPHRASGRLALHVLEVMEAFQTAADTGATVAITTPIERPAPLAQSLVDGKLEK